MPVPPITEADLVVPLPIPTKQSYLIDKDMTALWESNQAMQRVLEQQYQLNIQLLQRLAALEP